MKQIVVTGSLAFDYIMDFPGSYEEHILPDKIKTLSVSFLVQNLNKNFGGTAGNIAYTLVKLKSPAAVLGSVGKNDSDAYISHFNKLGINTRHLQIIDNEYTATAYIMTDKNNCQITGFYQGAMKKDVLLSLDDVKKNIGFAVISPTEVVAMEQFIKHAKKRKIPYLFSPGQRISALSKNQLIAGIADTEILIGNDYEIYLILEKAGMTKNQLRKTTKIVITTLGEKGSLIESSDQRISVGVAKPAKVVDPTGAGDAYIAGFIAGYTRQLHLQICGQLGAVAATYAIEQYGTQNHTFTMKEFNDRYKESFGGMKSIL